MRDEFRVKTEIFEGPLELLLHLIEKRKLFINDISLATVTDDFLSFINDEDNLSISQSANFIWVASTLLLIKSRSLLPNLTLTEEEEGDIENLERRLKLYKQIKALTPELIARFGERMLYPRQYVAKTEVIFAPDATCTAPHLYAHISAVIKNLPKRERVPQALVEKVVSLEEMIEELSERITSNLSLSFKNFAAKSGNKSEEREAKLNLIVSFLAMLELVKRGILDVKQESSFGDIIMETEQVGTPKYL